MKDVVIVAGPTAVGKTDAGVVLAKTFGGEVINGDALQVYQGLNIGTAKITTAEMKGVSHHLIDIKTPDDGFTAAEFQTRAQTLIHDLHAKQKLPIIVGGTGLYIKGITKNLSFRGTEADEGYRQELTKQAETYGIEVLYEQLKLEAPELAKHIHPNNEHRIIRALEVAKNAPEELPAFGEDVEPEPDYNPIVIGLTMERSKLYERINLRVDQMIESGLVEEVRRLLDEGYRYAPAMKAIGYKELVMYLDGELTLTEAAELVKKNTRRFAKRQLTWFRNKEEVVWIDVTDLPKAEVHERIVRTVQEKRNLPSN
ncbi:tRNA dimethylallyltransferase [Salsuginibacillus halophilus]|uniref:tRNA dimethylallyltransferase n=1 Tax=Salsuginibacillus halophilus TaxID=517424 RepID=A0A2P8HYI5_9BACI|nr:tRNA (adenosine(37)-N6)-dimethylallyltransferase MiaA [Salsuginibacillus halophilus]PSL51273.1 tRNA dimethylallyltransferase [Salsuginibacillus halophilus]